MLYTLPFIAALIGWFTNWIAVKMLFHPRKPIKILFFSIQGVFPKRQKALAEKLGTMVANELFSVDDVIAQLKGGNNEKIMEFIDVKIDEFIQVKLPSAMPMLGMFLNAELKEKIKQTLLLEISALIPGLVDTYAENLKNNFDVKEIVYQKVLLFSNDKLEDILNGIMKKEFKFIEIIGGVLGFLIGLVQLLIAHFQ